MKALESHWLRHIFGRVGGGGLGWFPKLFINLCHSSGAHSTMFSLKAFYRCLMQAIYTLHLFLRMMEKSLLQVDLILRVHTHQQSRVGSHPVQSYSQRCSSNSVAY